MLTLHTTLLSLLLAAAVSGLSCLPGTVFSTGNLSCVACNGDTMTASVGMTACSPLDSVSYKNTAGNGAVSCPVNRQMSRLMRACFRCPQTHYPVSGDADTCTPCPVGRYASPDSPTCDRSCGDRLDTEPTRAMFSKFEGPDDTGYAPCQPCGFHRILANSACRKMTWADVSGANAGWYWPDPVTRERLPATKAVFQTTSYRTYYHGDPAIVSFSDLEDTSDRPNEDTFYNSNGYHALDFNFPRFLSPGQYVNSTGAAVDCPAGTFNHHGTGAVTACVQCGFRTYQPDTGKSACTQCAAGTYHAIGSTGVGVWPCGSLCPDYMTPVQHASTSTGSCAPCPSSKAWDGNVTYTCSSCEAGFYADSGLSCEPCPVGTFGSSTGQAACQPCPAGTFSNTTGARVCQACPSPFVSTGIGAVSCSLCPDNRVRGDATTCVTCPDNHLATSGTCSPCPPFYKTVARGDAACILETVACDHRSIYNNDSMRCEPCPINSVALPVVGCTACPIGTEPSHQFPECVACTPTRFRSSSEILSRCQRCSLGTIANANRTACVDCPAGTYRSGHAMQSCAPCPSHRYSTENNTVDCELCPPDTDAVNPGAAVCDPCSPDRFSLGIGLACTETPYPSRRVSPDRKTGVEPTARRTEAVVVSVLVASALFASVIVTLRMRKV